MSQQPNLNAFQKHPEAAALLQNQEALKALLQSPDAKRLMELLSQQNGQQLKQAAAQAGNGDTASLSAMLNGLSQSKEGRQVMERLQKQIGK